MWLVVVVLSKPSAPAFTAVAKSELLVFPGNLRTDRKKNNNKDAENNGNKMSNNEHNVKLVVFFLPRRERSAVRPMVGAEEGRHGRGRGRNSPCPRPLDADTKSSSSACVSPVPCGSCRCSRRRCCGVGIGQALGFLLGDGRREHLVIRCCVESNGIESSPIVYENTRDHNKKQG